MGFKSEPIGKNYKKVENMWNNFSDDTGAFPKLKKMEENDIEGANGMQLVTSINFQYIDYESTEEIFIWSKEAMLESC